MITKIKKHLQPQINQVENHSIHKRIHTPAALQCLMTQQVFTVWSSMSLLKALQQNLTKTSSPWIPLGSSKTRYCINALVLAEESTYNYQGRPLSTFEIYLKAMNSAGANTASIEDFLLQVTHGTDIYLIIAASDLPLNLKKYLKNIFEVISEGKPHNIAAAYAFGRATLDLGLISILENIEKEFPDENLKSFQNHLKDLKSDKVQELPYQLLEQLCAKDAQKLAEAKDTARSTLENHINLWDGIEENICTEALV